MHIAVVGGGPAGLRAAEVAARDGASVTLYDAKPSVGRKFLVAGRGGLNITKDEPLEVFARHYSGPDLPVAQMGRMLAAFDPAALRAWAAELGIETFVASTGRVYPREMKAAPLLRRWVQRLRELGVRFAMHHRFAGMQPGPPLDLTFQTPRGAGVIHADAVVLALGGGSWPETGSDGHWVSVLQSHGVTIAPLAAANCGWEVAWPPEVLAVAEGKPLKNIRVSAGSSSISGELMITRYGLEGGAIYQLGSVLREMISPALTIDFKPGLSIEQLIAKLGPIRRNFLQEAATRWKLPHPVTAVLSWAAPPDALESAAGIAHAAKSCPVPLLRPRPIDEAISSAGGVCWKELDESLMLKRIPGVFVAGEMIDWEAPTGGYLMQGCFATGTRAGHAAAAWAREALS
jgi:uncharacterized flavoprotein (TIGR03862 family)